MEGAASSLFLSAINSNKPSVPVRRGSVIMYSPSSPPLPMMTMQGRPTHVSQQTLQHKTTHLKVEKQNIQEEKRAPENLEKQKDKDVTSSRRKQFNIWQRKELEEIYLQNPYPSSLMSAHLAEKLGITSQSIKTWFKNQRARRKRKAEASPGSSYDVFPALPTLSTYTPYPGQRLLVPGHGQMVCYQQEWEPVSPGLFF